MEVDFLLYKDKLKYAVMTRVKDWLNAYNQAFNNFMGDYLVYLGE